MYPGTLLASLRAGLALLYTARPLGPSHCCQWELPSRVGPPHFLTHTHTECRWAGPAALPVALSTPTLENFLNIPEQRELCLQVCTPLVTGPGIAQEEEFR